MITPAYGLTATERVLPSFMLDWTTGLVQSAVDVNRAGVATFVGSNGLIQSASADTQRIDYSAGTAGLLVEESRTNLVTYSDNYDDPSWVHANGTITPDTTDTVSPEGTFNADAYVPDSGLLSEVAKNITVAANTNHAASIFVKAKGDAVGIRFECSASSNGFRGVFNLLTGTVISAFAIGTGSYVADSAKIEPLVNGWYRISLAGIGTSSVGTTTAYRFRIVDASGSPVVGDGTRGLYIYGSQLEAGAFPTSYIPTEASAVTRNADYVTVPDISWFNPVEGAIEIEAFSYVDSITGKFAEAYAFTDGTSTNRINCGASPAYGPTGWANLMVRKDNVSQVGLGGRSARGQFNKICSTYKADNFASSANGLLDGIDTSGQVPTTINQLTIGSILTGFSFLNGWIKSFRYWPQRITTAETTAFSKKG